VAAHDPEEEALRAVALRNADAIHLARRRAEEDLVQAKAALEARTGELSLSLSLMHATLESTADGILVTQVDGRIVTFNAKFAQIWGIARESFVGTTHADLVQAVAPLFENVENIGRRIAEIYATPALEVLDALELGDGRTFERYSRPQILDGRIVGRVWSYRDVSARRQVEEAVRDEARMLDLLNRTGTAIASTLDLTTLLQTVTDAATQLSGAEFGAFFYNTTGPSGDAYMLYTLSGAPREAFAKFGEPRATPLFATTFNGEAVVRSDDVLQDPRYGRWSPHHGMPAGHLPVRSYLAVPVASRGGETVGGLFFGHSRVGVFTERTERLVVGIAGQASVAIDNARLYEEARRIAVERERLIEAERAARSDMARVGRIKDEFLATLSHELRTPLTAVLGWAKVLSHKNSDPDTLAAGLQAIERNAAAQARLIEDLLDMNRIISGKVRLDVQPTDIVHVVNTALEAARPAAEAKQLRLRKIIDPLAGPVSGDPNRLQQVMWNLITNAVKFTPRGGKIDVVLQRVNSHLELSVSDSGVGIAPEFLPHVFDRFRQADSSTTRVTGGLGLGLSIVKQLVELHGGSVRAQSDGEGRGATFVVCLPLTALRAAAEREHPAAPRILAAAPITLDIHGLKILVVDDEPDARALIEHLLRECQADVVTAGSAGEALAMLQRVKADVLISDIGMPERDGYQLIREVRRLPRERGGKTPAIALTAFARSEDYARDAGRRPCARVQTDRPARVDRHRGQPRRPDGSGFVVGLGSAQA
jgi:PAS domain S-box-containing protein